MKTYYDDDDDDCGDDDDQWGCVDHVKDMYMIGILGVKPVVI